MRLLLSFFSILLYGFSFGQTALSDKLDFVASNLTVAESLIKLSEESQINIAFSNSILPQDLNVNVNASQETFKSVLNEILDNTNISYRLLSGQIILYRENTRELETVNFSGYIEDADTGEKLVGANIYNPNNAYGTDSNEYGYFNFYGVPEVDSIFISYLGYETQKFLITKNISENFIVKLKPSFFETIIVTAADQTEDFLRRPKSGVDRLDLSAIQNVISIGGEPDLFQASYQLGGINTGADGVGGLHVRGGNLDQNLILLDGAPIYRPEHAVGVLSVFNSDAVRSAKVYKGNFPAKYGGRLSSVIDVQTKEGNNQKFEGKATIGLLTAKASAQGPIIKDKASFFVSYRRSLTDLYIPEITEAIANRDSVNGFSNYFFFDFNAKANFTLSKSDRIYLSYYQGRDDFFNNRRQPEFRDTFNIENEGLLAGVFNDSNTEELNWGNQMASLRWNHIFGDRIFANTTAYFTNFEFFSREEFRSEGQYDIGRNDLILTERLFDSKVNDQGIKIDIEFLQSDRVNFKFGAGLIKHNFSPGSSESGIQLIDIPTFDLDSIDANIRDSLGLIDIETIESFAYYETGISLSRQLQLTLGLHARIWNLDDYTHTSILPRIGLDYQVNDMVSLSASYLEMIQYLHLLTKSDIGLPGDIWVPATEDVVPEEAIHLQFGIQLNLKKGWKASATTYYKKMDNLIEFLEGDSTILLNALNYESKVTQGEGTSRGIEFDVSKTSEKYNFRFNYTWSKTDRQFEDLNEGKVFPYRYDLRHVINIGGVYHFNKKWSANMNWSYSSGVNLTLAIAKYDIPTRFIGIPDVETFIFSEKNAIQLNANQRLDVGVNYRFKGDRFKHALSFGIYNVYNNINPIYLKFRRDPRNTTVTQVVSVSLLPITPAFSYSISF